MTLNWTCDDKKQLFKPCRYQQLVSIYIGWWFCSNNHAAVIKKVSCTGKKKRNYDLSNVASLKNKN